MMTQKPLKRNENLKRLSKDHHFGLLAVWKIKQGIRYGIDKGRIKKYISFFWENYLRQHFHDEETLLFNKLYDSKVSEALQQHDSISTIIKNIHSGVNDELLLIQQLAEKLEEHIRFEERILFPHIEKALTAKELKSIGTALKKTHDAVYREEYADEFWAR